MISLCKRAANLKFAWTFLGVLAISASPLRSQEYPYFVEFAAGTIDVFLVSDRLPDESEFTKIELFLFDGMGGTELMRVTTDDNQECLVHIAIDSGTFGGDNDYSDFRASATADPFLGGDCVIEEPFRFSLHGNRRDHKIEYYEGSTQFSANLKPMQAENIPFENPDACGAANWVGMVRSVVDLVECDSSLAIQHLASGKDIVLNDPETTFSNGTIVLRANQELNYYASLRARAARNELSLNEFSILTQAPRATRVECVVKDMAMVNDNHVYFATLRSLEPGRIVLDCSSSN